MIKIFRGSTTGRWSAETDESLGHKPNLKATTFDVFEGCSEIYLQEDKHWGCDLDVVRAEVDRFDRPCILDAGCGPAWHLANICQLCSNPSILVGIDYSTRMLKLAEALIARNGLETKVMLYLADMLNMPFRGDRFEIVICFANTLGNLPGNSFEESNDARMRALSEFARVLKAGGSLVLSVYNAEELTDEDKYGSVFVLDPNLSQLETNDLVVRFCTSGDPLVKGIPYYSHWFTVGEIERILTVAGFRIRTLERRMKRIVCVCQFSATD